LLRGLPSPCSILGNRYAPSGGYGSDLESLEKLHLLEHGAGTWGPADPMFFGDGQGANDPWSFPSSK
tara:strand:- start:999 stop:1199 length:201 start_codon:yes stop_codon:yes gene_type:complete